MPGFSSAWTFLGHLDLQLDLLDLSFYLGRTGWVLTDTPFELATEDTEPRGQAGTAVEWQLEDIKAKMGSADMLCKVQLDRVL